MKSVYICLFVEQDKKQIGIDLISHYFEEHNVECVFVYKIDKTFLLFTFNIYLQENQEYTLPSQSFTAHRNSRFNTIYTINALNVLIQKNNRGVLDRNFKIDWSKYPNMLITIDNQNQLITKNMIFVEKICF